MDIKQNLKEFYNAESEKYANSRSKHRSDADMILAQIQKSSKKTISILEFGCGSGRLLQHLSSLKGFKINYIGIDISNELLKIAKKNYKATELGVLNAEFICDDITNYIKSCRQESFDFVVGIASFQHIPTIKERFFLIKNFYRILKYDSQLIMTNRALSQRFIQKNKNQILHSLLNYIFSFGRQSRRDILVPWKTSRKTFYRFYHLFSLSELEKLAKAGGFIIDKLTYLDKNGSPTKSWTNANNSMLIAIKQIFKE